MTDITEFPIPTKSVATSEFSDPNHGPLILLKDTLRASVEAKTGGRLTVLYDDQGHPNVMHVLPRFRYEDLGFDTEMGTGDCTAFLVDGVAKPEIFLGAYQASNVGAGACSLPYQTPRVSINWDNSKAACEAKGTGWHMMTVHEWAAVALWCIANGFEPRGNTNHGRAHDAPHEVGTRQDGGTHPPGVSDGTGNILTGSGPAAWRHDGTYAGIADLVGNVWEWQWGLKLDDGEIFVAPDNDFTLAEGSWPSTGKFARGDLGGGITLAEEGSAAESTTNVAWTDTALVEGYTSSQLLRRVLVEPSGISIQGRFYSRDFGERFPIRGGSRAGGGNAGLAALYLYDTRTVTNLSIGFRPAFVP